MRDKVRSNLFLYGQSSDVARNYGNAEKLKQLERFIAIKHKVNHAYNRYSLKFSMPFNLPVFSFPWLPVFK